MTSKKVYTIILAAVAVFSVFILTPVSAAGATQVSLHPINATVSPNGTVTYDLVVENAEGGIGSYQFIIGSSNASIATITDVSLNGRPDMTNVSYAEDGSRVYVSATMANTADTASVTIATVTVTGKSPGTVAIAITANKIDIVDEAGNAYSVTSVSNAMLTVAGDNTPPTANAGVDKTIDEKESVTLDATGSIDPNGDSLSYSWEQISGPAVDLIGVDTATPQFNAPTVESIRTLRFELTVSDGNGGSDSDTIKITVQPVDTATQTMSPETTTSNSETSTSTADVTSGSRSSTAHKTSTSEFPGPPMSTVAAASEDDSLPWLPLGTGGALSGLAGLAAWRRYKNNDSGDSVTDSTNSTTSSSSDQGDTPTQSPDDGGSPPGEPTRIETDRSEFEQSFNVSKGSNIPETIPRAPSMSLTYDQFNNQDPIGQGGNADVYRATVTTPDGETTIAVKEPRMQGTLHTETVERLLREADTWAKLDDHDHVVNLIDYGSEPVPWIAMEFMDAGHLGERVGELSVTQALWTAVSVTDAVNHAHHRGVAHLDLKPTNILFRSVENAWDVPKVADWGLSKHLLDHSQSIEGYSPQYAAPEQFDDAYGEPDHQTDVYQLGAVFYELFTGEPVFEGQTGRVISKVCNQEPEPPSERATVPEQLDDILLRSLAKDKSDRYESVLYLRDDLDELRRQ